MAPDIEVQRVDARLIAVVRRRAVLAELATVLPDACGVVWSFIYAAGYEETGRNVALYLDSEMNIECGVEVGPQFRPGGEVVLSATPAGRAVHAVHRGPYTGLAETHAALRKACASNGLALAGPGWEVYGHWTKDPSLLTTDVYYLLADGV